MCRLGILFFAYLLTCLPSFSQSYLVLPFFNQTSSETLNWIGESVSESLSDSLASEGILVSSRTEREEIFRRLGLRRYARLTRASVIKAGMALDASVVVYGDVEGTAPSLRLTTRVLLLKNLSAGSEFSVTGSLEELSALQTRLAWQTLNSLTPGRIPSEQDYRGQRPPVRTDALENYVAGLLGKTDEARVQYLLQSAKLDPHYGAPAFELGKLYFQRKQWQEAALWLARLSSVTPRFREAQFYLGLSRYHLGDFGAASQAFATVAQVVPLSEVYNNLGAAQNRRNDATAVDSFQKAVEGDDADPNYRFNLGYALMKQNRYADAAQQFRAVLDRSPNDVEATQMLGRCLRPTGLPPAGLERLKTNYQESAYLQLKAVLTPEK